MNIIIFAGVLKFITAFRMVYMAEETIDIKDLDHFKNDFRILNVEKFYEKQFRKQYTTVIKQNKCADMIYIRYYLDEFVDLNKDSEFILSYMTYNKEPEKQFVLLKCLDDDKTNGKLVFTKTKPYSVILNTFESIFGIKTNEEQNLKRKEKIDKILSDFLKSNEKVKLEYKDLFNWLNTLNVSDFLSFIADLRNFCLEDKNSSSKVLSMLQSNEVKMTKVIYKHSVKNNQKYVIYFRNAKDELIGEIIKQASENGEIILTKDNFKGKFDKVIISIKEGIEIVDYDVTLLVMKLNI